MVNTAEITNNNEKCTTLIDSLQTHLIVVQRKICEQRKMLLRNENLQLQEKVRLAKAKLIEWELKNGKKLFPIPIKNISNAINNTEPISLINGDISNVIDKEVEQKNVVAAVVHVKEEKGEQKNKQRNNKEKEVKTAKTSKSAKTLITYDMDNNIGETPNDIRRLDLRVGKILEVKHHPDADSLYLEKIDCGDGQIRTVVSGLVKFIPIPEIQNRLVMILCNLKPMKMRGIISEAMVMCASTPEKVEILSPPGSAQPGDLVHCEGYPRQPDAVLNPKKKIFEACAPDMKTNESLVACYKGAPLHIPGKGPITAQTLKNVPVK